MRDTNTNFLIESNGRLVSISRTRALWHEAACRAGRRSDLRLGAVLFVCSTVLSLCLVLL